MDGDHLADRQLKNEAVYDTVRLSQWLAGPTAASGSTNCSQA
jgi:hypothetical protein